MISKILLLLVFLAVAHPVAVSQAAGELGANSGNNANPHNLSSLSQNVIRADSETQICVFCHIPHGASPQSQLWSRFAPDTVSFPLFDEAHVQDPSGNLGINDPAISGTTQYGTDYPNGASKLCLSCHDGVTALGILINGDYIDFNGDSYTSIDDYAAPHNKYFGAGGTLDLATSHPISFVYNTAVVNYLNQSPPDVKTYNFTLPSTIQLDAQSRIQCTICHDPHKDTKEGTYNLPFWRKYTGDPVADYDNTCNECHSTVYGAGHNNP